MCSFSAAAEHLRDQGLMVVEKLWRSLWVFSRWGLRYPTRYTGFSMT